jgi:hypothetical protein
MYCFIYLALIESISRTMLYSSFSLAFFNLASIITLALSRKLEEVLEVPRVLVIAKLYTTI